MSQLGSFLDARPGKARRIGFIVVAAVTALLTWVIFGSIFAIAMPWIADPPEGPGYEFPATHRWHDAQYGAHTGILLAGGTALMLWRRMRKPLLMQFLVIASVIYGVLGLIIGQPGTLAVTVLVVVIALLYPNRRELLTTKPNSWNIPLLVVAVIAAAVMLPYAIDMFQLQIDNVSGDEHAEHGHWGISLVLMLNLLLAGVLAATGRPGARTLAILAGVAFLYLGVAALTSRDAGGFAPPGIWSTTPAILSILAGAAYIAAAVLDERLAAVLPRFGAGSSTAG